MKAKSVTHVDDRYNKLKSDVGNDFRRSERVKELYAFQCGNCSYRNIHDVNEMTCGCGKHLFGRLVYRKVGDTAIYDARQRRSKK